MLPWLIPAGIQAGSALLKFATRKKTPSFRGTAYGRYLQETGQEGKYSSQARMGILGQVSSTAGNIAQQERARTRGYLEARGMGGSIAGVSKLAEPGLERQRIVAGESARLTAENELSKQRAQEEYAMRSHESQMQRAQEEKQSKSELFGGIAGAAGAGAQTALAVYRTKIGYGGEKAAEEPIDFNTMSESELIEWVQKQRDPESAWEMLLMGGFIK